ncbi:hypothetical protein [Jiella sonneratiae]|uniref:Uncharacterized protein n=1 Tax=Jiella sonneratiae TaxID=2816856 RepID=A0ABS3J156_9HYPH|nr:hypothetical protein [Jiella sonneratiae]MBO0903406.1 hypothetical protein [Jiella sonneratiae]
MTDSPPDDRRLVDDVTGTTGRDEPQHLAKLRAERCVPLGSAWAGSSVNCKTYATEGLVQTGTMLWGAFYDHAGMLAVYGVADGAETAQMRRFPIARAPRDAHDTPALQTDRSGVSTSFAAPMSTNRPISEVPILDNRSPVSRMLVPTSTPKWPG